MYLSGESRSGLRAPQSPSDWSHDGGGAAWRPGGCRPGAE